MSWIRLVLFAACVISASADDEADEVYRQLKSNLRARIPETYGQNPIQNIRDAVNQLFPSGDNTLLKEPKDAKKKNRKAKNTKAKGAVNLVSLTNSSSSSSSSAVSFLSIESENANVELNEHKKPMLWGAKKELYEERRGNEMHLNQVAAALDQKLSIDLPTAEDQKNLR